MVLPEVTAEWLLDVTGSRPVGAVQFPHANTATVYRVTLDSGGVVVVKRYDVDDPYDRRPDRAAHEAAVLEHLADSVVPVPELIAVDANGAASGAPTVLMEHVAGTMELRGGWLEQLADLVAVLHGVDPGEIDWQYEPYVLPYQLSHPAWASDIGLWDEALTVVSTGAPRTSQGFIHRDLHAGNIMWHGGEIAAVIDWMSACIGPSAIDLSHCRANLAMDHGIDIADRFLESYLRKVPDGTWHPHWDVVDAVDFLPYWAGQEAIDAWHWDDRPPEVTRRRFEEYLQGALVAMEEIG